MEKSFAIATAKLRLHIRPTAIIVNPTRSEGGRGGVGNVWCLRIENT